MILRFYVCICLSSESKLFQADAVQNQEMLQKAYEAANRVKVIFAKLEPLLCFGTNDNCPKTIFISLISSKAASFLAASLKLRPSNLCTFTVLHTFRMGHHVITTSDIESEP